MLLAAAFAAILGLGFAAARGREQLAIGPAAPREPAKRVIWSAARLWTSRARCSACSAGAGLTGRGSLGGTANRRSGR